MSLATRQRLMVFVLAVIALSLAGIKFVWPLYLKAQTSAITPLITTTSQTSAPAAAGSCSVNNVFEYVAPDCKSAENGFCPAIHASVVTSSERHIGDVTNRVQWINDDDVFRQWSNDEGFIYRVSGDAVLLAQDNVWGGPGGGQKCSNGSKAMYRLMQNGAVGAVSRRNSMSCGEPVESGPHNLIPYVQDKSVNDSDDPLNFPLNECDVPGYGAGVTLNSAATLIYNGQGKCNPELNGGLKSSFDIIVIKNTAGPGVGEVYVYCKGYGLCAFYETLDDDPANWSTTTDFCDLKPKALSDTYFEYNLRREDTSLLLKNLSDEYSVSCMPKVEYKINQDAESKCQGPGKICPGWQGDWNVTGSLGISAGSQLFGLFRDGEQATSRYLSGLPATNRLESLENYLGVKGSSQDTSVQFNNTIMDPTSTDTSLYQAPIYKLTSWRTQCDLVKNKLKAVAELCDASNAIPGVDTSKNCPLNTRIPSFPNDTHLSLWAEIKDQSCASIMETELINPNQERRILQQKILNTPLFMENAYRPAFIVAVTRFEGDSERSKPTNVVKVSTDNAPSVPTGFFTVVDYMEIRVPAFGSDFMPAQSAQNNLSTNPEARNTYKDPLRLTADILRTLEEQEKIDQEYTETRATIRSQVENQKNFLAGVTGGPNSENPIYCRNPEGGLDLCSTLLNSGKTLGETLPAALTAFINGYASARNDLSLMCDKSEKDDTAFYSAANKKRIAEEALKIGSKLQASEKVGNFTKVTEANVSLNVLLTDITQGKDVDTITRLYFVSPHGDTLEYVRDTFYSFLTQEDQQKLAGFGITDTSQTLNEHQFPPAMKTSGLAKFSGSSQEKVGLELIPVPKPLSYSVGLDVTQDDETGLAKQQPIIWKLAGQVASLPTRLMALVTTPLNSAINNYTLGCTSDGTPNEHATEDWLLGKCKDKTGGTEPEETPLDEYLATEVVSTADCRNYRRIGTGPNIPDRKTCSPYTNSSLGLSGWLDTNLGASCDTALYKYVVCTNGPKDTADGKQRQGSAPALIAHRVNPDGSFSPTGPMTACEFVVSKAKENGVSPRLALAMWGEESGFSALPAPDFGVVSQPTARVAKSMTPQVSVFLNTVNSHRKSYLEFLQYYSGEKNKSGVEPAEFCNNPYFPDRLKEFFGYFQPPI